MRANMLLLLLILPVSSVLAQSGPPAPGQGRGVAVSTGSAAELAEIRALRAAAKPLVDHIKSGAGELPAIKRRHAEARRKLKAQGSGTGAESPRQRKAVSDLLRTQREEFRRAVDARRAENRKFERKNPEAKRAFDELVKRGIPVEEPPAGENP